MRAPAAIVALFVLFLSSACTARPRAYVRVAEGLAAGHLDEAIFLALPQLTSAQLQDGCRLVGRRIVRLATPSNSMQTEIGQPFALAGLSVVAVDDADVIVRGVPLAIEARDQTPPVLLLRRDDPDLNRGTLRTLNTGEFLLRIYTLCGVPGAEMTINVKVVPVPPVVPPPTFPGQVTGAER